MLHMGSDHKSDVKQQEGAVDFFAVWQPDLPLYLASSIPQSSDHSDNQTDTDLFVSQEFASVGLGQG